MRQRCSGIIGMLAALACLAAASSAFSAAPPTHEHPWFALHVINYGSDEALDGLAEQLPALAKRGINCLILEVNYGFEFESHPELRAGKRPITKAGAARFAEACRANGIELVPQFQCLGHQSWAKNTGPLLTKYPELDLTPGAYPENKGIYCREWDPTNPRVNEIVFALMDELADAFDAKAFHVGMDEVFLLQDKEAKSTKDRNSADVFAQAVNDYHDHLVGKRGLTMLMWADRLIDGDRWNMGEWEASKVGTAAAIDKIPRDIILCPWHYEPREAYESVPYFMEQGFRVLPASWKNVDASNALIRYSRDHKRDDFLVGHIFTTWSGRGGQLADWPPLVAGIPLLKPDSQ
ncbi:MAG: family 20 glycosylhydrolase [Pirellulales bacterium]